MTQGTLINFDKTMAYNPLQGNMDHAQITVEELKQTLYNLTPQQHAEMASTMVQQDEDFPSV